VNNLLFAADRVFGWDTVHKRQSVATAQCIRRDLGRLGIWYCRTLRSRWSVGQSL